MGGAEPPHQGNTLTETEEKEHASQVRNGHIERGGRGRKYARQRKSLLP